MSAQEEHGHVYKLPGIIKELADEVTSRDNQIRAIRASLTEELSAVKEERDVLRAERDESKRLAKQYEAEMKQSHEITAKEMQLIGMKAMARQESVDAEHAIEATQLQMKIKQLEEAALHREEVITQLRTEMSGLRTEVLEWKGRYLTLVDDSKRQSQSWNELTKAVDKLEGMFQSASPSIAVASPLKEQCASSNGTPRQPRPGHSTLPASGSSKQPMSQQQPHRKNVVPNGNVANARPQQRQRSPNSSTIKKTSQSTAPDRVLIRAEYEVKLEDDGSETVLGRQSPSDASGSKRSAPEDSDEDELAPKRRRTDSQRRSVRRVVQDDDGSESAEERSQDDDDDEMAIGAEDNHKEIYGHRRVNVREVPLEPRTPQRSSARGPLGSGNSSGKKRKPEASIAHSNRTAAPLRTRR
ncbi:hypothetical protein M422DRAFT_24848 [Sphaerobolus stellatus SS14]|nr:hypothetical protein M422DRAFT_24848 [Sphaerobolus stellatus SS14]